MWCVEGAWETLRTGPASSGSLWRSIAGLPTSPVTPSAEPSSSPRTKDPYPLQPRAVLSGGPSPTQPRVHLSQLGTRCILPLKGQAMVSRESLPGITALTVTGMSQDLWGHLQMAERSFWSQAG